MYFLSSVRIGDVTVRSAFFFLKKYVLQGYVFKMHKTVMPIIIPEKPSKTQTIGWSLMLERSLCRKLCTILTTRVGHNSWWGSWKYALLRVSSACDFILIPNLHLGSIVQCFVSVLDTNATCLLNDGWVWVFDRISNLACGRAKARGKLLNFIIVLSCCTSYNCLSPRGLLHLNGFSI